MDSKKTKVLEDSSLKIPNIMKDMLYNFPLHLDNDEEGTRELQVVRFNFNRFRLSYSQLQIVLWGTLVVENYQVGNYKG
jgi:septation ring formation regulator EzrA